LSAITYGEIRPAELSSFFLQPLRAGYALRGVADWLVLGFTIPDSAVMVKRNHGIITLGGGIVPLFNNLSDKMWRNARAIRNCSTVLRWILGIAVWSIKTMQGLSCFRYTYNRDLPEFF